MAGPPLPDRYEPMPSLLGLPRWLLLKLPPRARRVAVIALALVGLSLVAVTVLVVLPAAQRRGARERRVERAALQRRLAAVRRAQRPHAIALARGASRSQRVAALERAIARYARTRRATCTPVAGPGERYACDAILARVGAAVSTLPFYALLEPGRGRGAFCRDVRPPDVPTAAELRSYRIPVACGGPPR